MKPVIAITSGEPAGIGPDICLALAGREFAVHIAVIADADLLAERARMLGVKAVLRRSWGAGDDASAATLDVVHVPLVRPCRPGILDPGNSPYVLGLLDRALEGCLRGEFAAMVTAPVNKGAINDAGIAFTGHTEYLAQRTGTDRVVMMLVGGGLRVALATTHLALKDVPGAIRRDDLERTLRILFGSLRRDYGIDRPLVLVAGLNPHGGESGHLGSEEIEVIAPVLEKLIAEGYRIRGPLAADTLFTPDNLSAADCVLAMYHDQGLPVLKHASFGKGVNVTLGLPILRTSVDHGTALELAGSGRADSGSLIAAIEAALEILRLRPVANRTRP